MKRIILLAIVILLASGCANIKNSTYESIISETTKSDVEIYNTYRRGYKFYSPVGVFVTNSKEYNEILKNDKETYYMYIDLISYLNKVEIEHTPESNVYYTKINEGNKTGYVEIKLSSSGKYLVEIMYNYAKIEVMVEETRIKNCLSDAMVILSSIKYDDAFLETISKESLLNYKEETVDIFNKKGSGDASQFLEYVEEYDNVDEETLPDYDKIN